MRLGRGRPASEAVFQPGMLSSRLAELTYNLAGAAPPGWFCPSNPMGCSRAFRWPILRWLTELE
jgi:hypothetical protein